MKDPKTVWAWVGGVIVVLVAGGVLAWRFFGGTATAPAAPTGPVAVHAPAGQLVEGFPPSLILDTAARMNDSYSINYSTSTNQYTAEWVSSSSLASLYSAYQNYAQTNGWTVTNHADYATFKGLYAKNASSTAAMNVIITPAGTAGGTNVSVTYINTAHQ